MTEDLRNKMIAKARENGTNHGKTAELDFRAGAEWMHEQLRLYFVSQCNDVDSLKSYGETILLIGRKDGLTDLYTDNGCLGTGLTYEQVKEITGVSYCG